MSVSAVKENGYSEMITSYKKNKGQCEEQALQQSSQNVSIIWIISFKWSINEIKGKMSQNTALKKLSSVLNSLSLDTCDT